MALVPVQDSDNKRGKKRVLAIWFLLFLAWLAWAVAGALRPMRLLPHRHGVLLGPDSVSWGSNWWEPVDDGCESDAWARQTSGRCGGAPRTGRRTSCRRYLKWRRTGSADAASKLSSQRPRSTSQANGSRPERAVTGVGGPHLRAHAYPALFQLTAAARGRSSHLPRPDRSRLLQVPPRADSAASLGMSLRTIGRAAKSECICMSMPCGFEIASPDRCGGGRQLPYSILSRSIDLALD